MFCGAILYHRALITPAATHIDTVCGLCVCVVIYLKPPRSAVCVSPRRSSAAVYWERESFPLVCELIFYELGVGFELNRDLDVQSSSSSLFIPHPYCRTSLTNFCVRLCTLIPRPLTNSKLGYAPGLLSHPSKYVSAFRNVCV